MRRLATVVLLFVSAALVAGEAAAWGDGPEISRSRGKKDGIVVLWPRIVAEAGIGHEEAVRVQNALVAIAQAAVPGADLDIRPEPERACPRETGCRATALGAVLAMKGEGCAVVATVSLPGTSAATLVPWVADVGFKNKKVSVPFREPPEAEMIIQDFAPCTELASGLDAGAPKVTEVVKAMARTPVAVR